MAFFSHAFAQDQQNQESNPVLPFDSSTHLISYGGTMQIDDSAGNLYDRALEWLDTAFRYSVSYIRIADKQSGNLVCKETVEVNGNDVWFTASLHIRNGRYKFEFTNIYFDHLGSGTVIVPCELMTKATKKEYNQWTNSDGLAVSNMFLPYQSQLNKLLAQMDGAFKYLEFSLNDAMTRRVARDSW
jgi:hypothetical protein